MRWIIRALAALVGLALVLIVISLFLPREVSVTRSTDIAAMPEAIFPLVNSMQRTQEWSPWLERAPDVQVQFSGPESGVGNVMRWTSEQPDVGSGTQEITESVPDSRVATALDFGDMGTAAAQILLEPLPGGSRVTWGFTTDTGYNPVMRWMGLKLDDWVGADYEDGLARLKALAEKGTAH
jgi:hypothetical protein